MHKLSTEKGALKTWRGEQVVCILEYRASFLSQIALGFPLLRFIDSLALYPVGGIACSLTSNKSEKFRLTGSR